MQNLYNHTLPSCPLGKAVFKWTKLQYLVSILVLLFSILTAVLIFSEAVYSEREPTKNTFYIDAGDIILIDNVYVEQNNIRYRCDLM